MDPPAQCQQSVRASAAQLIHNLDKLLVDKWEFIVHSSSTSLLWEDHHFSIKVLLNMNSTLRNSHILYTFPCCLVLFWVGFLFSFSFLVVTWICLLRILQYKLQPLQELKHLTRRTEFAGHTQASKRHTNTYRLQITALQNLIRGKKLQLIEA